MFEQFFNLAIKPFSKTPDPKFLFMSKTHEEALARLQYAVEEKEIVVLTGEIGCGKTTLTRALIDSLGEKYRVILIINPRLTPAQFLRVVAKRFEIECTNSKEGLLDSIYEKVYQDYEAGITPVIIIDEAQLVPSKDTFEEMRLLTNFQLDDTNLLSLVLVGQPDLRRRLNHRAYQPLKQRVGLYYHLTGISEKELAGYIKHRLQIAGRREELFTTGALTTIYRYSGGVPRLINSIANTALLEGFGSGSGIIDEGLVQAAALELGFSDSRVN